MRTYNILLRNVTSPLTEAGYHVPALLRSCYHPVLDTQLDTVAVNPVGAFHDATFIPERHTSHQDASRAHVTSIQPLRHRIAMSLVMQSSALKDHSQVI